MVPDEVRRGQVYVLGQNPGEEEEAQGAPFVGKTGGYLERKLLPLAGLSRDQVDLGNALRCRIRGSNKLPGLNTKEIREAIAHCQRAYYRPGPQTRIHVALGVYATYALTGEARGEDVGDEEERKPDPRGYLLHMLGQDRQGGPPSVFVSPHPARLFGKQPQYEPVVRRDWRKVGRILAGTWPRQPPSFLYEPLQTWPGDFALDTEFTPQGKLVRYSMTWGGRDGETAVVEAEAHLRPVWNGVPRITVQYAPADVLHLQHLSGVEDPWRAFDLQDTVWLHALLWPDLPHNLNFLGSLYGSINRWKHLADVDPQLYAGCDSLVTWEVKEALEAELGRDPQLARVWEMDKQVLKHFVRGQQWGLAVDRGRAKEVQGELKERMEVARRQMQAVVGWPINPGSGPQVGKRLWEEERL